MPNKSFQKGRNIFWAGWASPDYGPVFIWHINDILSHNVGFWGPLHQRPIACTLHQFGSVQIVWAQWRYHWKDQRQLSSNVRMKCVEVQEWVSLKWKKRKIVRSREKNLLSSTNKTTEYFYIRSVETTRSEWVQSNINCEGGNVSEHFIVKRSEENYYGMKSKAFLIKFDSSVIYLWLFTSASCLCGPNQWVDMFELTHFRKQGLRDTADFTWWNAILFPARFRDIICIKLMLYFTTISLSV